LGIDKKEASFKLLNKYIIHLIITDTCGQERARVVMDNYYSKSDCIILSYDITNRYSFEECKSYYWEKIKILCKPKVKTMLLGNKKDLNNQREVRYKEASDFVLSNEYMFIETSCKTYENVYEAFEKIIEVAFEEIHKKELIKNNYDENKKKPKCNII